MRREYYQQYYHAERSHWWFKVREQIIKQKIYDKICLPEGSRILNVGCGTGRSSQMLQTFGEVHSIEYDSECYEFVKSRIGIEIIQGSATDLPYPDGSFELVCAFDVIEHIKEDEKAVNEMARVCKNDGFIFITVPALKILWGSHDEINRHERRYRLGQIRNLFKDMNGKLTFGSYFNSILFIPILLFRLFRKLVPDRWINAKTDSDLQIDILPTFLNNIFYNIFLFEKSILRRIKLPVGVSIIWIWKKEKSDYE